MTETMWIVLVIAALIIGIVAGEGVGSKKHFIDGMEMGVNLVAWCEDGKPDLTDGDDGE